MSLARVNELHNEIKKFINVNKTNVSTKYLNDYILFFNYIRNYKVRNSNYPSSKKDIYWDINSKSKLYNKWYKQ